MSDSEGIQKPTDAQKIASTFSPINSTDRSVTTSAKKRRRPTVKRLILMVGFIIMVALIAVALIRIVINDGESSPTNQVKSVFSGDELREYNSPENNFSIKFPGFPTVTKS